MGKAIPTRWYELRALPCLPSVSRSVALGRPQAARCGLTGSGLCHPPTAVLLSLWRAACVGVRSSSVATQIPNRA